MFYNNTSDVDLSNELLLKSPDIYIMKHIKESTGKFTLSTTGNDTLTDTSAAFSSNELASTVGKNIYIVDDNNKIAVGNVISNGATTIVFQAADMKLISDGTTAPTLTAGGTYSYRVLSPSSFYEFGDFIGYTQDITLASEPEIAEFKYSIPRRLIRQDLLENIESLNFAIVSLQNADVMKEVYGMSVYGKQTSQVEYHRGTSSFNTSRYQITFNVADVNNKTTIFQFFKTGMRNNGEVNFSEEGYKMIPVTCSLFQDTLRDSTSVDSWMYRKSA